MDIYVPDDITLWKTQDLHKTHLVLPCRFSVNTIPIFRIIVALIIFSNLLIVNNFSEFNLFFDIEHIFNIIIYFVILFFIIIYPISKILRSLKGGYIEISREGYFDSRFGGVFISWNDLKDCYLQQSTRPIPFIKSTEYLDSLIFLFKEPLVFSPILFEIRLPIKMKARGRSISLDVFDKRILIGRVCHYMVQNFEKI